MRKAIFLFLTFCLLLFQANILSAQAVSKDSLSSLARVSEAAMIDHNYTTAIEAATKLLKEASQANNPYYQFKAYNLLGMSYEDLNDTLRCRKYYQKALEYALKSENDTVLAAAYNNLGNIYSERKDNYQKGIRYYNEAINVTKRYDDSLDLLTPVLNIGWTYVENAEYDKAFPYLKKSSSILGGNMDSMTKSQLYTLWGMYYAGKNRTGRAKKYYEEAVAAAEQDSLFIEASYANRRYADFLTSINEYENAYEALSKHIEYQSEILEIEKIMQIEAANAEFELSEYQRNLELAQKEQVYKDRVIRQSRQGVFILIVSAIIMLVILLILYKTNRTKKALIVELQEKNKELFKTKEEAIRLSNLKTSFFSTVSHELRTPLYGVVGLTSLLLEDKSLKKHEDDLNSLKFSADYLLALINDVLQMNKMESNLVKLEKVNFNLYELMSSIVKSFEFTRLQNKNSIHLEIDKNIPNNLKGDSIRLSQIMMNLAGNAMKFTENGQIWLIARLVDKNEKTSKVYFEVRDNGVGIPLDKQQEIFDEFSQLKNSNYNYQGTGLGLSIVKRLLKLFDSEVHLVSEEGKGSSFNFELTFENVKSEKIAEMEEKEQDYSVSLVGKIILVVDDNRINRAVTKRILEKKGVVCEEAVDGEQAIEKVKSGIYDLVLMDVNMPKLNGLQATEIIRGFNKDLPIIALTAVEIGEMRGQIFFSGMNDYIIKPYDIPQFFQTLMRNIRGANIPAGEPV